MLSRNLRRISGGDSMTLTHIGSNSGSSPNPKTYADEAIGDASGTRHVIVAVTNTTTGTTGVTIGGNTATEIFNNSANSSWVSMYMLKVPTGTTADIVLSFSGFSYTGISVYTITGKDTVETPTTIYTDSSGFQPAAVTVSIDDGEILIGNGTVTSDPPPPRADWTEATESSDYSISSFHRGTTAHRVDSFSGDIGMGEGMGTGALLSVAKFV